MSRVLIVDDEPSICWAFREFLTEEGHDVSVAASAEEAFQLVETAPPDAIVLDVRLPGLDGLSAIERFRSRLGDVPVIVITAFGNLETAVQSVQEGAFEYLPKPFDVDQAAAVVKRALDSRTASDNGVPDEAPAPGTETLVGKSPAMQQVFKQIALAAASDVPVLITGESGTGKELVARAVHNYSRRREQPFIPVCLPALSPGVVESEIFGHVKGAFTGAESDRLGLLELAAGGTAFFDEVADADLGLQVKLLRAIERKEVTPVGASHARKIDVRIIAATNRPLPELIARGAFREDLYFRLGVFQVDIPPLRERREDIPELARHFLRQSGADSGGCTLSERLLEELQKRPWRGNVRELRNVIEHAAIVSRGHTIEPEHLPEPATLEMEAADPETELAALVDKWARLQARAAGDDPEVAQVYERFLQRVEPPLIRAVLDVCDHNRAAAAQLLGMHRTTLRQKMRRYGID